MNLSLDNKLAGLLVPVFALRTEDDLGIGDTAALRRFIDWSSGLGFGLVQILPINETGSDNSPYNAISSGALDPTTIETSPRALSDLTVRDYEAVLERYELDKLRSGPVCYPEVKRLKRELLWCAFRQFKKKSGRATARWRRFGKFEEEHASWLSDFALFRALIDRNGTEEWDTWPTEQSTAASAREWLHGQPAPERRELEHRMQFYRYVQWIAYAQWSELRRHAETKRVALMGDVPIGVSYYSSDVFANPEVFDLGWSSGAPPEKIFKSDPFTEKWGQNWGSPLYRWDCMRKNGFGWWRRRVRSVRVIFHLFRIDHILGFYRIYAFPWRPDKNARFFPLDRRQAAKLTGNRLPGFRPRNDNTVENREANRRDGEEILKVLVEEVGEHRLIGEDLGVVPDYVRPSLTALGIAGFKIPMWENDWQGRHLPGQSYQRLSVATYATHDHDPIRTFWENWHDEISRDGHDKSSRSHHSANHARRAMRKLMRYAGIKGDVPQPWTDDIHEALCRALSASNAWIAIYMITDLLGTTERFNLPGAVADTNWTHRLAQPVDSWTNRLFSAKKAASIRRILKETGRFTKRRQTRQKRKPRKP